MKESNAHAFAFLLSCFAFLLMCFAFLLIRFFTVPKKWAAHVYVGEISSWLYMVDIYMFSAQNFEWNSLATTDFKYFYF